MKKIGLVYKCVVIGDPHAGKSSILHRLKHNIFKEKTDTTIGVDFVSKIFDIQNSIKKRKEFNININVKIYIRLCRHHQQLLLYYYFYC